jgi:hypothetical protein
MTTTAHLFAMHTFLQEMIDYGVFYASKVDYGVSLP